MPVKGYRSVSVPEQLIGRVLSICREYFPHELIEKMRYYRSEFNACLDLLVEKVEQILKVLPTGRQRLERAHES